MSIIFSCRRLALTVRKLTLDTSVPKTFFKFNSPCSHYIFAIGIRNYTRTRVTALKSSPKLTEQLNQSVIDFRFLPDLCERILIEEEFDPVDVGKLFQSVCASHIYDEKKVDQAIKMFDYLQTLNSDKVQPTAYAILMGTFRGKGEQYEKVIFELLAKLKEFSEIFPRELIHYVARGLCETSKWKEALDLIEMERFLSKHSDIKIRTPIVIRAIKEGDVETVSTMLNDIFIASHVGMTDDMTALVEELFLLVKKEEVEFTMKDFCDVLQIMRHQPPNSIADMIMHYFNMELQGWNCVQTSTKKRICNTCGYKFPAVEFSKAEMKGLSDQILQKRILKSDIYLNTDPREFQNYLKMVEREGPFDVVIDGLNVGLKYSKGKSVLEAVKFFKSKAFKNILVIGRDHMLKWNCMEDIKENAILFLVNNLSEDDPFILYAASQSPHTFFVTYDYCSNHVHGLDREYYHIFCKWIQHRQIKYFRFISNMSNATFPIQIEKIPHYNGEHYHIPYTDNDRTHWLCVRKQSRSSNI